MPVIWVDGVSWHYELQVRRSLWVWLNAWKFLEAVIDQRSYPR
jgi:hypothetical protein